MKTKFTFSFRLLLLCMFIANGVIVRAQSLFSPAFIGGATNAGTLLKINADGSGITKFYDFNEFTGSGPMGSVIQASDGKLYGTCINGGTDSSCVIYNWDTTTQTYTNCWSFDIVHGDFPMSGMILGPGGILYGAASAGGPANAGVIYSYNTTTQTYTDLYELDSVNGYGPSGSPLLAGDGNLYGMVTGSTFVGQYYPGNGSIYKYDISNNTFTNLYSFNGLTEGFGYGSLIEHNGIMYGMTSGETEYAPSLMFDMFNDSFYALPAVHPGNLFSFNPATLAYSSLHNFDSIGGWNPYGTLLWANNGKMYGMTSAGGAHNFGVIFSYDAGTNTYTKLHDFDGTTGATPMGDLMQNADGKLYGATTGGGTSNFGVIFSFDPIYNNYSVLYNLDRVTTGAAPLGGALSLANGGVTDILTPKNNTSLSVYPVPAHNTVTVNIESTTGDAPLLTLTDVDGRTIWGPRTQSVTGNAQIQLDLSTLEAGVYFLQVTTGDNVAVKRIVRE